ncbi:MAG TPA: aminoacyl-tRNA hydrolase [Sedimentisphaerales bacterium]|nr:aminoacyl-tRNA hydrolase [Sedimentisphaerales bacterium]
MGDMRMIVGLGNPGDEYRNTRHNMGFKVIDALAAALDIDAGQRKFGARFGSGEFAGKKLILLKPWRFMNRSGQAVATAAGFYKLDVANLLVVTDDMDLEPGRIRVRAEGSGGGHNGLADIIEKLGTNEFARCRIGIGRSGQQDAVDFVLDEPAQADKALLAEAVERARDAVVCWIEHGIDKAMNVFNRSGE